jgi:hypothetical protein
MCSSETGVLLRLSRACIIKLSVCSLTSNLTFQTQIICLNTSSLITCVNEFLKDWRRLWMCVCAIRGCIQKFSDWPTGARTAHGKALCHEVQFYRYFVSQSSEFYRHTLCVASQRVLIVVVYFVIYSVRKLLDTPS